MTTETPAGTDRASLGSKVLVAILASLFILSVIAFAVAVLDAIDDAETTPSPSTGALAGQAASDAPDVVTRELAGELADPPAAAVERIPIVPVSGFWSTADDIGRRALRQALETGRAKGFDQVVVESGIAESLAARFRTELHGEVKVRPRARVERAVARGALGLLAATDVSPRVKALSLDGASLFGVERIRSLDDWPLMVELVTPGDPAGPVEATGDEATGDEAIGGEGAVASAGPGAAVDDTAAAGDTAAARSWDQRSTWTLVAGGDSFTDRGVHETVVRKGRGVDFPFDGGTARVTGRGCCDPVFNDNVVPRYQLTGNKGLVRRIFRGADLAIANHEQPVTEAAVFHGSGTRFSGKPELTRIFKRAGIDYLSLANNHIKDYGGDGIKDTRRILRDHGIAFGGAGKDLEQARKVRLLDARGTSVAIIPCLDFVRTYWATSNVSGATPCVDRMIVKDIRRAKRVADVVIVFPHWGVEYTRQPLPSMRKHAARWVAAGADLIIGAHSHVAGSIQEFDGVPVLYSLGNLIFDQHWSTNTMESVLLEATFHGDEIVQLRLRPYIIHAQSQPNLLDPTKGEGRRLLREMKAASGRELDW